ncbi:MAG: hypothetical protein ACYC8W_10085 [Candidatus Tyrphobacter sp.]
MKKSTTLAERIVIAVPLEHAPHYLERFFSDQRDADARETTLRLTVPGPPHGAARGHAVFAAVARAGSGRWNGWNNPAEVSWYAECGGPHPIFPGGLKILADEGCQSAWLVVDDGCIPGGSAGRAFDTAGYVIALGTARQFLSQLKTAVERYHGDEQFAQASAREHTLVYIGEMR